MERGGSQRVSSQESKEGEEGFHSRRTEILSGQHASCEPHGLVVVLLYDDRPR